MGVMRQKFYQFLASLGSRLWLGQTLSPSRVILIVGLLLVALLLPLPALILDGFVATSWLLSGLCLAAAVWAGEPQKLPQLPTLLLLSLLGRLCLTLALMRLGLSDGQLGGVPLLSPEEGLIPSELRIRLCISKPYLTYVDYEGQPNPGVNTDRNGGLGLYTFDTKGLQTVTEVNSVEEDNLDEIGVVPNPYYAFSGYETSRLDNRVKFINLPRLCTINIYNVSGTLIRTFRKDNDLTYVDWDLKNHKNVPISGGTYICHIEVPGAGETVLKWFGVMRPVDLQNF